MAYFPNGASGEAFENQCAECIYMVQSHYNYDACNNDVAMKILNDLVKDDGTCEMFEMDPETFKKQE